MHRGELWWATLPEPVGSEPGYRRPVLISQDDSFSRSRIQTVIVVVLTSNLELAKAPENSQKHREMFCYRDRQRAYRVIPLSMCRK